MRSSCQIYREINSYPTKIQRLTVLLHHPNAELYTRLLAERFPQVRTIAAPDIECSRLSTREDGRTVCLLLPRRIARSSHEAALVSIP